jgi:hypothetical protein
MPAYWQGSPEKWDLINSIQQQKRVDAPLEQHMNVTKSDNNVMINPVTGQEPSKEDLEYAKDHMQQIYDSGMIREDRWAFLWYH